MEPTAETEVGPSNPLQTWLFNPFHYIAGSQALVQTKA